MIEPVIPTSSIQHPHPPPPTLKNGVQTLGPLLKAFMVLILGSVIFFDSFWVDLGSAKIKIIILSLSLSFGIHGMLKLVLIEISHHFFLVLKKHQKYWMFHCFCGKNCAFATVSKSFVTITALFGCLLDPRRGCNWGGGCQHFCERSSFTGICCDEPSKMMTFWAFLQK